MDRALSVRDWLVAIGIPVEKLIVRGYGHADPVGDNRISEGRDQNRRVVFKILNRQ
jgi:outer membrane protein OmpA-like peptidoglycan-associated protein